MEINLKRRKATTSRPLEDRFWEKVIIGEEAECWEWQSCLNAGGYGSFSMGRRKAAVLAHRLAFQMRVGPIPAGILVCHTCDNRKCVNPSHLFLGDHKANAMDMARKGRGGVAKGEGHGKARLTGQQVLEIRDLIRRGVRPTTIARAYGIKDTHVNHIKRRTIWKSV